MTGISRITGAVTGVFGTAGTIGIIVFIVAIVGAYIFVRKMRK